MLMTSARGRWLSVPPDADTAHSASGGSRQNCGVSHHLVLVLRELRLHGLPSAGRLARDDVHQQAALALPGRAESIFLASSPFAEDDGSARDRAGSYASSS